jgi:hypothetical protein
MTKRTVLTTETIRGMEFRTKNDDEMVIWFPGSKRNRDAFALWLRDLREDAVKSPAERYEVVRRQMDSSSPSASE